MNAPVQTSHVPPSIALALMTWRVAYWRAWGKDAVADSWPAPSMRRDEGGSAHREYYRLIDQISRGELRP